MLTDVTAKPTANALQKNAAMRVKDEITVSQEPHFAVNGDASKSALFLERYNATSSGDFDRALSQDAPSSPVMAA